MTLLMDLPPILSTLRRHRTAAGLIVLEIALSCAILCNAVQLIAIRVATIGQDSGIADNEIVRIGLGGISRDTNSQAQTKTDLAVLRDIPGVKSVTVLNQIPFGTSSWNTGVDLAPDQDQETIEAEMYMAGPDALRTLGVHVVAGRDFTPDEVIEDSDDPDSDATEKVSSVIITESTAKRLFPNGDALGKQLYHSKKPLTIVGIVSELASTGGRTSHWTLFMPIAMAYTSGMYYLRCDPADRSRVLEQAVAALEHASRSRVLLEHKPYSEVRDDNFRDDRRMVALLVGVGAALLIVTAFGIVGLASFWVQQRTRMIGIRRALGATRRQIRSYFQIENLLLTSIGIVLGMFGAYGINHVLLTLYEVQRLPLWAIPVGAVTLLVLGQIAVLAPALRAAALPPVVVMRSA